MSCRFPQRTNGGAAFPCGNCRSCRLEYSRQWAMRCVHEASLYQDNAFVTLTLDDEHLPERGSLEKTAISQFMRALRRRIAPGKVRFFGCGEYGEEFYRPHYHVLLFGFDFPDKEQVGQRGDHRVYGSQMLDELWGKGFAELGDVTFESAAYVARYVMKKVTGKNAQFWYLDVDEETGETFRLQREFALMSRRPGIGRGWFERFGDEVRHHDSVVMNGREVRPPRYYSNLLEPEQLERLRAERLKKVNWQDQTRVRLAVKAAVEDGRLQHPRRGSL